MSKIEKREFEEFLKTVNFYLVNTDLTYIWNGNIKDKVFQEFYCKMLQGENSYEKFIKYIDFLDPKKVLICIYMNAKRLQKGNYEREKILQSARKLLDNFKDEKLGYIRKFGDDIEVVSMFDVYNNDNLTSQDEMKEIIEKLSYTTILQLMAISEDSENLYAIDNLRPTIIDASCYNYLAKNNDQNSQQEQEELMKDMVVLEAVDEKRMRKNLVKYARYVDIKKICLKLFSEVQSKLESGEYKSEEKEIYENTLKQLYQVIKGKNVTIDINGKEYSCKDATIAMQQFCGNFYFKVEEIEEAIENITKNSIQPDEKHIAFVNNYIKARRRKIHNFEELKFFANYIFNNEELLQMYLNGQIEIEDIEKLKIEKEEENEEFEIISDNDFIQKYKEIQDIKQGNVDLENKLNQLSILYAKTNANGVNRNNHINNILNTISTNKDLEYLLQMGIINEEEVKVTKKRIEQEKIKKQEMEKEQREKMFKEQLKTIDGVQNFLENGILTESEVIEETIKGNINKETFIQLYLSGKINLNTLKEYATRYDLNELISNENIINEIASRKGTKNYKKEMNLLALYRRLKDKQEEEKGKAVSEIEEEYKDFILFLEVALEEQGKSDTSSEDRIKLYNSGILPIDTIIDWGDKEELTNILSGGKLKLKDVKELYSKKIINNDEVTSIIKAENTTLAQKIALLSMVYNGNDEYRNQGLQTAFETIKKNAKGNKKGKIIEEKQDKELESMLSNNSEMIKSLISIDNETEIETTDDGHIIVHLPNMQGGIVVIEQLYSIDTTKNTIKPKKGNNIYIIDEYEYINRKEEIIKDEEIDKKELGELEKQRLANRQVNISPESIKKVFENGINNQKYSEKEKSNIEKITKSAKELTI